jgi:hypothetical protein
MGPLLNMPSNIDINMWYMTVILQWQQNAFFRVDYISLEIIVMILCAKFKDRVQGGH